MSGIIGLTPDMRSGIIGGFNPEYDVWNFEAASDSTAGFIVDNLARQESNGQTYLGKGMTESSGVFTFPSIGTWDVRATALFESQNEHRWMLIRIARDTTGAFSGSESILACGFTTMPNSDSDAVQGTCTVNAVIGISDLAHKVKFHWQQEVTDAGSLVGYADGTRNQTYFTFQKLSPSIQ